jgi:hypothetical protein
MLNANDILGSVDVKKEAVEVPEWGGTVYVTEMTGTGRDAYERLIFDEGSGKLNLENVRAKLLVCSLIDEDGNHLFKPEDHIKLGKKSSKVLDKLFGIARDLNKITADAIDEEKKD